MRYLPPYMDMYMSLEKEMAAHSSTFAWKLPWTEEPDRLQSMGLQRAGHDWVMSLSLSHGHMQVDIIKNQIPTLEDVKVS